MSEQAITCIGCPMGCRLRVRVEDGRALAVDGAACGRGAAYARQECACPTRMVTSLVRVRGLRQPLSVKTARPVPKEMIFSCLARIHEAEAAPPVRMGDVIVKDVCGTGVDVVATMDVEDVEDGQR
jgi:CxxC motif-containing protein